MLQPSFKYNARRWSWLVVLLLVLGQFGLAVSPAEALVAPTSTVTGTYTNPLPVNIPGDGQVESCADPSLIHSQQPGDSAWYMYCTSDPLNGADRNANGDFNFHSTPILKSFDLVHWTYLGDAFKSRPVWAADNSGIWAPDIHYFNGLYYLYVTIPDTKAPLSGASAIGVATSNSPTGPWTFTDSPVVEPNGQWTFDPAILEANGKRYIYYGSYFGGIRARELTADGLHSLPATTTQITIPNRYEGAYVVKHEGYYYLFGSATNCCNGPLTGYSIFAGRSANPLGPFVDREGVSLLDSRVGGTPVISMNGNRWVGPGHNAVFQDFGGQDWVVYHAVDRYDPYFTGATGFTKRPVLLDPLDWVNGWPTVRGGLWASDTPQPAPAAQPGQKSAYIPKSPPQDGPASPVTSLSDEFNGTSLSSQWSWVRQPAPGTYGLEDGTFRFDTQQAELYVNDNTASVLTEPTPQGNYVVETRFKFNVPVGDCCHNFAQAGLIIYGDDDNYIKLTYTSIFETRQTEFAKEASSVPPGYPRYGNTVVGPPGEWTYLRIVKRNQAGEEYYTAYTSQDGQSWVRGGTWTHKLGSKARIGLISMNLAGFKANFDYVRVSRLKETPSEAVCSRPALGQLSQYSLLGGSQAGGEGLANLVDNYNWTFWRWTGTPKEVAVQVDLGEARTVSAIKLFTQSPSKAPNTDFQYSQDGKQWYALPGLNDVNAGASYGSQTYPVEDVTARYFRIVLDNNTYQYDLGYFSDLQLCTRAAIGQPTGPLGQPVSERLPIVGATASAGQAETVLDNLPWTSWVVSGKPSQASLKLDLGQTQMVTSVVYFATYSATARHTTIEYSTDGTTWQVLPGASNINTGGYGPTPAYGNNTIGPFGAVAARYIRLRLDNPEGDWALGGYGDIQILGYSPTSV